MDRQPTPRLTGLKPVPLQILYELTLLIDPPPVPVPGSDKVMVFNNPQAAEVLRCVSAKVRELIDFEPRSVQGPWAVAHHYTGGFVDEEWWTVVNGATSFRAGNQLAAVWLADVLNTAAARTAPEPRQTSHPTPSSCKKGENDHA